MSTSHKHNNNIDGVDVIINTTVMTANNRHHILQMIYHIFGLILKLLLYRK